MRRDNAVLAHLRGTWWTAAQRAQAPAQPATGTARRKPQPCRAFLRRLTAPRWPCTRHSRGCPTCAVATATSRAPQGVTTHDRAQMQIRAWSDITANIMRRDLWSRGNTIKDSWKKKNVFLSRAVHLLDKWCSDDTIIVFQRARQQKPFLMIDGGDTKLVTTHCTALPQALTSSYLMFQCNVIFQNTKAIKTTKTLQVNILHLKYLSCFNWMQAN